MFYSDYKALAVHFSRYVLRFHHHYDEYVNSTFVRSVDFDQVVWC